MPPPVALIVDDVHDLLNVMAEVLEIALPDHRILTASSAAEATSILDALAARGDELTLVIADQSLGDRTGLDLLTQVRAGSSARLFLISGRASDSVAESAASLGAQVLWKPFRMQALVDKVREALL